jgi:hypothetical protein
MFWKLFSSAHAYRTRYTVDIELKTLHPECSLFKSFLSWVEILQTRRPRSTAYYYCTKTYRMVCDAQKCCQNVGNIVVNLWSQKENEPNISSCTHSTPHTNFDVMLWRVVLLRAIFRRVPVILWVHIFTEINSNFIAEQKECGGLFRRHVTTVSSADESRLAEAANFYVVRYLTGSDQRYERDKLRTWSKGIPSQQMCRQKNNDMRSEIKGTVTPISVDTIPPRTFQRNSNILPSFEPFRLLRSHH